MLTQWQRQRFIIATVCLSVCLSQHGTCRRRSSLSSWWSLSLQIALYHASLHMRTAAVIQLPVPVRPRVADVITINRNVAVMGSRSCRVAGLCVVYHHLQPGRRIHFPLNHPYSESKNYPWGFVTFPPNGWEFLLQILQAYYTFLCMLEYKFLCNDLQLWWGYAILSATTQCAFRLMVDILAHFMVVALRQSCRLLNEKL